MSDTTSLIVALKGSKDLEKTGKIIRFGNGANLDTVRGLAAEKLAIGGNSQDLVLLDGSDRLLDGIDDLRKQQVVYVDLPESVKEIIPGPTKLPFVGNLYEFVPDFTAGWNRLFKEYGPLVDTTTLGVRNIGTNDPAIAELFVKEGEYFTKKIAPTPLSEVKVFAGQGLFTTDSDEDDWKLAHKLLMPAFSPRAIKAYQHEMGIITQKTIKILDQMKPNEKVDILDWTTKVTFETIGRIGFGYEFNLLEEKDAPPHPLIQSMGYLLQMVVTRRQQAQFMKHIPTAANRKFDQSMEIMHGTVSEVIAERKRSPDAKDKNKDMLGFMLNARDENDHGLSDENIRDQVVTFLIAGHDTTANTLAWVLYEISRNPDVEAKILQEIANTGITHDKLPTSEQISNLKYMHQTIKETLRKYPPVRALSKYCKKECIVPYGYKIPANTGVSVQVYSMHHNEKVYPDPERFDPDRFSPEEEQKRSRSAWLPFSTGPRACIGMAFALQEAKTVLAMFLHKYKFCYDGPDVHFDPRTATTKPEDLLMTVEPRTDFPAPTEDNSLPETTTKSTASKAMPSLAHADAAKEVELPTVTFLYGTQTGTAQDYSNQLLQQAKEFGFEKVNMVEIDKWKGLQDGKYNGPTSGSQRELVVICTATYNGQPPDTAEAFNKFIDNKTKEQGHETIYKGLLFSIFGVGNKNWRTYQHFPRKVDEAFEEFGAERFFPRGEGNADQDMDAEFNEWCAHFWSHVLDYYGIAASQDKSVVPTSTTSKRTNTIVTINYISPKDAVKYQAGISNYNGEKNAIIKVNRELQQEGSGRSTRHIEIDISALTPISENADHFYNAGDHLEVMPENDPALVNTIALNYGWILDSVFEIDPTSQAGLSSRSLGAAIKGPCTIRNALTYYADLSSPPTRTMLSFFANQLRQTAPETAEVFEKLIMPDQDNVDQYPAFIKRYRTLLDLQKGFPQVNSLDFAQFISAAVVMQPRRYSIASSPLVSSKTAALTVGVVDDIVDGRHYGGLASSYLARSIVDGGDDKLTKIHAVFKSSKSTFDLPSDPSVPIIMISAGTGFSPFRGFIQERAAQRKQGIKVGSTSLFFGCRRADHDYIYGDELETFVQQGVLNNLHVAFSRQQPPSPTKYVQHQILANATEVWNLMHPSSGEIPANVYICGSGNMSRDVRRVFISMFKSFGDATDDVEAEAKLQQWIDEARYNEDVWG
ncbi:cytochrome P450 [Halteromyces radiatus]|uniref:cytochrome P450 n=1 Tax=Halteromyces radiatus TaxID=101107 RepID=UPI002220CA0D